MNKISLAMIVKNEEEILERCLQSFCDIVDEIIIVDTGSNDNTKKIAKNFTKNVFDFSWQDDFSLARNFAFSKCTMPFIIWADADDVFNTNQKDNFLKFKNKIYEFDVVMMKYNIAFDENSQPTFSYYRERILRNNFGFVWVGAVHEVVEPRGKIYYSNFEINHFPNKKRKPSNRNLKIYEKEIAKGKKLSARNQFYYARELMYNEKYKEAIKQFKKFFRTKNYWAENAISACRDLSKCFLKTGDINNAKASLFNSFCFDTPRGETCCDIGNIFILEENFETAKYWFSQALDCTQKLNTGAFVEKDCYGLLPHLQLCYCYYKLGDIEKSKLHNDQAGQINNSHPTFIQNKKFFDSL